MRYILDDAFNQSSLSFLESSFFMVTCDEDKNGCGVGDSRSEEVRIIGVDRHARIYLVCVVIMKRSRRYGGVIIPV